ncbi:SET domain-containing protein-lysine N-methyltransferase [Ferruginibacter sp. SUN106]|uniref:SET domain-containing protein-lysine N-methyltransferase n=1 Tax=Ferruginibacter sp. SUN106 TaxID=2978348 RepID=UPI003D369A0D
MKKELFIQKVKNKGRGVFCNRPINRDEVIEVCPVLALPAKDYDTLVASQLVDYFFNFNKEESTLALALGFGSLYNHAVNSNAAYVLDRETKQITFFALEDIPAGKEICINYAGEQGQEFKEWFESRNIPYR